jgi:hypothetical protein
MAQVTQDFADSLYVRKRMTRFIMRARDTGVLDMEGQDLVFRFQSVYKQWGNMDHDLEEYLEPV